MEQFGTSESKMESIPQTQEHVTPLESVKSLMKQEFDLGDDQYYKDTFNFIKGGDVLVKEREPIILNSRNQMQQKSFDSDEEVRQVGDLTISHWRVSDEPQVPLNQITTQATTQATKTKRVPVKIPFLPLNKISKTESQLLNNDRYQEPVQRQSIIIRTDLYRLKPKRDENYTTQKVSFVTSKKVSPISSKRVSLHTKISVPIFEEK